MPISPHNAHFSLRFNLFAKRLKTRKPLDLAVRMFAIAHWGYRLVIHDARAIGGKRPMLRGAGIQPSMASHGIF
jgi:hypothetical protein